MISITDIVSGKESISLVGLGYVGLPIAIAFARKAKVIGFDVNSKKIALYQSGIDPTNEAGDNAVRETAVKFTDRASDLKDARFHIVAVPTPVRDDHIPDLSPLESASRLLGQNLRAGSVVVYESTVYPGVTEEVCVPILEKESGLVCGKDFKVGYSPERINPGDKVHRLETIVKIVSGMDEQTLNLVTDVYELVVEAGVHRAPSIRVAEAAKVIENSQRDINIAFMNELSVIFHRLGIDTKAVLRAAQTKWNFLNFEPGLVGGHCIGVDPYYLTYKSQQVGYNSQVILAGRRINDDMGRYIAECTVKKLIGFGKNIADTKIGIMGFTFKENCPDTRNTRVIDIIKELNEYGIEPMVADPVADQKEAFEHYGLQLADISDLRRSDCVIVAVSHREFEAIDIREYLNAGGVLMDVKGIYNPLTIEAGGFRYWRL